MAQMILQECQAVQRGLIREQADFRAAAEEVLGPRHAWSGNEDRRPASVMFESEL